MANYDTKVTVRFSRSDRNRLLQEADNRRLSLSALIRTTLLKNKNVEDQHKKENKTISQLVR